MACTKWSWPAKTLMIVSGKGHDETDRIFQIHRPVASLTNWLTAV
jgi:hypothetical protein